jgi:hypothetical protein
LRRFRRIWGRLKPVHRTIILTGGFAAIFVFVIYTVFYHARYTGIFDEAINSRLDQRMYLHGDVEEAPQPPLLLDFDAETMARLGDPIVVPPRDIATALYRLAGLRPKAVLVDLDLSYLPAGADLGAIAAGLTRLANAGIPVLLARDVLPGRNGARLGRLRPTPLDALVARHPNLIWVSTHFPPSNDGVVRTMTIVETVLHDGRRRALPSAPLVLLALERTGSLSAAKRALAAGIRGRAACAVGEPPTRLALCWPGGRLVIDLENNRRIDYRLSWEHPAQETSIPAWPMARDPRPPDPELFAGRTLILGSTAGISDRAQTPLEAMPGPWIHANAIHAWLTYGPDPGLSYWFGAVFMMLVTVPVALAMAALILWLAPHRRAAAREAIPLFLSVLFWIVFQYFGAPSVSVGLFVVSYAIMRIITFVEKRFEPHIGRRRAEPEHSS